MLVDTDVLIWYLRGSERARARIESLPAFAISVVTYMELVQGMRDRHELAALRRTLKRWNASIIYIDEEISIKAMFLVERLFLSNSVRLADALIAATAHSNGMALLTGDRRHYTSIGQLEIEYFQPD